MKEIWESRESLTIAGNSGSVYDEKKGRVKVTILEAFDSNVCQMGN